MSDDLELRMESLLFVVLNGELQMARYNTGFLVIASGIA